MPNFPLTRLRRTRQFDWSRRLVRETTLTTDDLVWALIATDGEEIEPVGAMPGVNRLTVDGLVAAAKRAEALGIPAVALFPHISEGLKDKTGSEALNPEGLIPRAVRAIKAETSKVGVMVDVALDPYTDHGHDGILEGDEILNDVSVEQLAKSAVVLALAGADVVAPSDMMDGRVGEIRQALDRTGHQNVMILSYAAKYASGFYGPYREAIGTSAALRGDKRTYQMDFASRHEALHEVAMDLGEGADMVMVKPGLPYLDIIRDVKDAFQKPVFAYQVSGEYAMIKAAGAKGWIDEQRVMMESLAAFKRAGCDGIFTYFAPEAAEILNG